MQETTQEKPPAAKGTVKMPTTAEKYFADLHADKLTRVPVAHLYFNEPIDFAGVGESQISNRGCVRLSGDFRRAWVCDFIPMWQVFELSYCPSPDAPVITEWIPAAHVRRFKRAV